MMIISTTTQHGSRTVRRRIIWQILLPQHLPSSYVMSSIQIYIYTHMSATSTVFRCKTCLFCTFQMRTLRAISVALEIHARVRARAFVGRLRAPAFCAAEAAVNPADDRMSRAREERSGSVLIRRVRYAFARTSFTIGSSGARLCVVLQIRRR